MSFFKQKYPRHLTDELTMRQQVGIFFFELVKVVLISLVIILPVRYFLIKPFYVKGASMEPNFYNLEYLIIDEISYRFGNPDRGDVVVFRYPIDPSQYFIKRVIGLPGETVRIIGGQVFIINKAHPNGILLEEKYLLLPADTVGDIDITLSDDQYYVLGDNRNSSLDSRVFGPLSKEHIIGRVFFRGWPLDRIGILNNTGEYNF